MSRWRRRLRRLRRWLGVVIVSVLILSGLCVALLSQLLPALQSRPDEVAAFMQRQLGVPVHLGSVDGEWTGSGVRLQLRDLRIGAEDGPLVPDAILWLRPLSGWLPGNTLSTLQLRGIELVVERREDRRWQVQGLALAAREQGFDLQLLERLGEVVLDQASLQVRSAEDGLDLSLARVDGRLRPEQGQLALALQVFVDDSPPLQLRMRVDADLTAGNAYMAVRDAPLGAWLSEAVDAGWSLSPSLARGDVWVDWDQGRLDGAQFRVALQPLADPAPVDDQSVPEDPPGDAVATATGSALPQRQPLAVEGRWTPSATGGEWSLREVDDDRQTGWLRLAQTEDGRTLQAADWQLGAWWPWLVASLPVEPAQRYRLQALAAHGQIEQLRLELPADGPAVWWLSASALGNAPHARIPGLQGLTLRAEGQGERARIALSAEPLQFDWSGLVAPMQPALSGNFMLWADEVDGWCLHALDLALREADYAIEAEGGLCFDGGAPSADLRVAVGPAEIATAKRFWVVDRMPETAVNWLNESLQGGRIAGGSLLLHGDLADWPFRANEGRMEAIALLDALVLRFRPDWPTGEALSGEARFINDGMEVLGSARLHGIEIHHVDGRVPRFRDARLALALQADTKAAALLSLLRESPLWTTLSTGLERVRANGPVGVDVALDIPLKRELGRPQVDGSVLLQEVDLRHEEWGIAFDGATGPIRFSERGVIAEGLEVLHVGRPGSFALRVGSFVEDPDNRVETRLLGRLDAGSLIDTQPELDWLKPSLDGVSRWDIGLEVPTDGAVRPRLSLDSDLVGTALRLPAPLRKSAATSLPLAMDVELGAASKSIRLELGELLRLRGVWAAGQPFNGIAGFGETAALESPEQGLRVVGQAPVVDAGGWLSLAGEGGGMLESIDLQSGEFDLFGRGFGETRLRYQQDADARRFSFDGEQLQGEVEIPGGLQLLQRGVTARFERMHWPADAGNGAASATPDIDPESIPPLHVHVIDLRLGDAVLGETRLEAYPQPGAMHVEQFSARSEALALSARGDWLRGEEAGSTRSLFSVEFTAQSLGGMLRALGFAEFVEGGQTLATLEGEWPGAPTAFSLADMNGQLSVSVGKGRIPDVDPGAGRLFGLFSLSEIPRRLALDFSDFFRSGLAFNRIEGSFALADGSAYTDELLIDSPSAEIRLRGRTGLRAQQYDQTMEVLPRAGNVLPVVGALAAGPAGAAIGAVAQAVLQNPFKQITRTLYSVNGSWDKPDIDVIERGPARPGAPGEEGVPGP